MEWQSELYSGKSSRTVFIVGMNELEEAAAVVVVVVEEEKEEEGRERIQGSA